MALALAELDDGDLPPAEEAQAELERRAQLALVDLVEPAKVIALQKLGESGAAMRRASAWYRAKAERQGAEGETE